MGSGSKPVCGAFWTGNSWNKLWKFMVLTANSNDPITVFDIKSGIFYETPRSNVNHYEGNLATLANGRVIVAIGGAMAGEEKFKIQDQFLTR